jgi:hypothetical protein
LLCQFRSSRFRASISRSSPSCFLRADSGAVSRSTATYIVDESSDGLLSQLRRFLFNRIYRALYKKANVSFLLIAIFAVLPYCLIMGNWPSKMYCQNRLIYCTVGNTRLTCIRPDIIHTCWIRFLHP